MELRETLGGRAQKVANESIGGLFQNWEVSEDRRPSF